MLHLEQANEGKCMAIQSASVEVIRIHAGYARAKRLFDIACTLLLSPIILLLSLIVIIMIRLDSKGPILYLQKRVGQNGVEFEMLKFRSMYVDSDDSIHREAIKQYMNGEALSDDNDNRFKIVDDDRVTRVGKFIRKTSLDELPQFWNVLRGEMSLVGPRPPVPYEVELYSPHDWLRLSGKPGLTGLWQVYGRSTVTFEEMVNMDIAYLQNQSLWTDLKLIVLTLPVMALGKGGA